jgi:predicted permease
MALGAGRARIVRQLVAEGCVLGILGGLAGFALTIFAWKLLPSVAPGSIPRLETARVDWIVFVFTLAVSIINSLVFGIVPALGAARRDPATALREAGTRGSVGGVRNRLRSALVIGEVAVAVILVVIGGLLTGSIVKLLRTDPGFNTDHVLASIIVASGDRYRTPERRGPLFQRIMAAVRKLPAVESAGTVDALPFSGENHGGLLGTDESVAQAPDRGLVAEIDRVSADYLQTMGVRLLEGRWFREDDMVASRDTAIVSNISAAHLWPGQSAIGKKVCMNFGDGKALCKQVVGVVSPVRHGGLDEASGSQLYYASAAYQHVNFLVVRSSSPSPDLAKSIQLAVASADPKQPVFLSATMSTLIGYSIADRRFIVTLLAITGCLALLLAAAGIYGVISYATSLRTQEIGVRMALGAAPCQVQALIFRHGMRLTSAGTMIGFVCAIVLIRLFRNTLLGLTSPDPALAELAIALVVGTAGAACVIPARRATRIDPMQALRQQ